jgi:hypothetical protein
MKWLAAALLLSCVCDAELSVFAVGKVIGLGLQGRLPDPALLERQPKWAWFLAATGVTASPDQSDPLRKLYATPRVLSR